MAARLEPIPTPDTKPFWDAARGGQLCIPRCDQCGQYHFYPRTLCPHCGSDALSWAVVSGRGTLASFVVNYRPVPRTDDGSPVVVAIVQLDEGPQMMTNLVVAEPDPEKIELDAAVTVRFQTDGDAAIPVFELAR
jgi:uncharacterized OB-fold protein